MSVSDFLDAQARLRRFHAKRCAAVVHRVEKINKMPFGLNDSSPAGLAASDRLRGLRPYLLALLAGAAGGWLAESLGVPLGWMVGSMFVTGILAASGVKLACSSKLRWVVLSFIGIYLGASFTPDVLGWITRSAISVTVMCVLVATEVLIASCLLCAFLRCNAATGLTACMPGGFSTMMLIASERGGDVQIVSVVQLVRMTMVILAISLFARVSLESVVVFAEPTEMSKNFDYAAAIALGVAGLMIGRFTKMPILCMFVPMTLGAFLQLGSVTHMEGLPRWPLSAALLLLGVATGCSWKSFKGDQLLRMVAAGLFLGVFLIAASAAVAWALHKLLEFDLLPLLLALAPGGVAELSLISVALDIEPAFVVLHHMLRVVFILFSIPFMFAIVGLFSKNGKRAAKGDSKAANDELK